MTLLRKEAVFCSSLQI